MSLPTATYRLQFRTGMNFVRAEALLPYLKHLGISHLYASPLFAAAPGSTHGYDVTDHNRLDPELGGEADFANLSAALKGHELGLVLDIVPNHMAAHVANPWWRSVIEWGEESPYAGHFDINWEETLTLPFLGRPLGEAINAGEISVGLDAERGYLGLKYYETVMPVSPRTYAMVLDRLDTDLARNIAGRAVEATPATAEDMHDMVRALLAKNEKAAQELSDALRDLSQDRDLLSAFQQEQAWRFMYWRTARRHLTYRRFFEVTGLVGVRVEDDEVFDDVHRLILDLVRRGEVDGLRIDHVDGLANPREYLDRLRGDIGAETYLIVEKILEAEEALPDDWPISGTTGYEFIAALAGLLTDTDKAGALDTAYFDFLGREIDIEQDREEAKTAILQHNLATELSGLTQLATAAIDAIGQRHSFSQSELRNAIADIIVAFPVYRVYAEADGLTEQDQKLLDTVAETVADGREGDDLQALDFVIRLLQLDVPEKAMGETQDFVTRFQQTTGPVMAKAVEDTLFYRRNRLIALNEVGGDPEERDGSVDKFHKLMAERAGTQPEGLSASSTHDTKRGEDARARLYALSEAPERWGQAVERWRQQHRSNRTRLEDGYAPGPEMHWLIYQALAGVWPFGLAPDDQTGVDALKERFAPYLEKAMREAKLRTSWTEVNADYEHAVQSYAAALFAPENIGFRRDFVQTLQPFFRAGVLNSLTQTALKLCAPGIPDIYQGSESWDYSLVDPDNRRPVPFGELARQLVENEKRPLDELIDDWTASGAKQLLVARGLRARQKYPELFARGSYLPLELSGPCADRAVAFARHTAEHTLICVAPRLTLPLIENVDGIRIPREAWGDTVLILPSDLAGTRFVDCITGNALPSGPRLRLADLLAAFPLAIAISDGVD